jgi:hypothetical protein
MEISPQLNLLQTHWVPQLAHHAQQLMPVGIRIHIRLAKQERL